MHGDRYEFDPSCKNCGHPPLIHKDAEKCEQCKCPRYEMREPKYVGNVRRPIRKRREKS